MNFFFSKIQRFSLAKQYFLYQYLNSTTGKFSFEKSNCFTFLGESRLRESVQMFAAALNNLSEATVAGGEQRYL